MHSTFASIADTKLWNGATVPPNQEALIIVNSQFQRWRFALGSTAVDTTEQLVFAPTTSPASGKWTRADPIVDLKLPWVFNTADGSVLLTVPTGLRLKALSFAAEVTTAMTGADTASIGLNASVSLNPGGLGRIVGIQAGFSGIEGAEINTPENSVLQAGATLKQNIIAAGYTAGAGFWHLVAALLQT